MKLLIREGGETRELEIDREDRKVTAAIGDSTYELDVSAPEPGIRLIKNGTTVEEVCVTASDTKGQYIVSIGDLTFDIEVFDPRHLRASGSGGENADGIAEVRTQMPGKVVRLLVSEGTEVSIGDGVVVVEAMKMQNELKSPKDGSVRELRCSEGETVNAGDVLVVIE